ncbi:hypothetical protein [Nonomuraea jabiensis]|uniref:hypothetical protein n=1 Tax=Nonomuraea jabiensis TaxID=882448 RepID=UPI0036C34667
MNVQLTKRASSWTDTLKRTLLKWHSSKEEPWSTSSVMSTSWNSTRRWLSPEISTLSQSVDQIVFSVGWVMRTN